MKCAPSWNRQDCLKERVEHLRRIAMALARDATAQEMAQTVTIEVRAALGADAIATFLLMSDGFYHMTSQLGCTPEFVQEWNRMPPSAFPLLSLPDPAGNLFIGSAEQFKANVPGVDRLVDASGRKIIGYAPLMVEGRVTGVLGFSFDRPPESEVDRDYALLLMNLCGQAIERARLSELQKSNNRAKTDFLTTISHEIRTPLGLIQGYTELLSQSAGLSEQQRHWAEIVHRNTKQLIGLVGDVLDLNKIEADKLELSQESVNLKTLMEDIRQTADLRTNQKGLWMLVKCGPLPEAIVSDGTRLRQIILNLIGNAIKFTSRGGVKLTAWRDDQQLVFDVEDTGIGIEPPLHDQIFEPYVQAESSTSRRFGGTGLGLPISRMWARALGGDLRLLRSAPELGSCFRLTLPMIMADQAVPDVLRPGGEAQRLNGKVLLVDDSEDNQELIGLILRRAGADVVTANSGAEALEQSRLEAFDIIVLDIQMPGIDGYEVCRLLRCQRYCGGIVALTAHALKSERERALRQGFDAYLTKPIDTRVLLSTLNGLKSR